MSGTGLHCLPPSLPAYTSASSTVNSSKAVIFAANPSCQLPATGEYKEHKLDRELRAQPQLSKAATPRAQRGARVAPFGDNPTPSPPSTTGHALRVQVVVCQLQLVVVAKAAKDGPGGFMPAPLDEERVEEEEACGRDQAAQPAGPDGHCLGDPHLRTTLPSRETGCWGREL